MMQYMKCICNALQINVVMMVLTAAAGCLLAATTVGGALLIGKPTDLTRKQFDGLLLAKLASSAPNQKGWWQLADADWHDWAIDRFFVAGPAMDPAQLELRTFKEDRSKVRDVKHGPNVSISDIIQKIQQVATTEYKMSKSIPGTGVITASLWTLLFRCPTEPLAAGCTDGSTIVPIVLIRSPDTTGAYDYATVWLQFPAGDHLQMPINAIPASIKTTPARLTRSMGLLGESSLSSVYNIHDVPLCVPTKISPLRSHFRQVLDSAYGLAPAINCVELQDEHDPGSSHFKVLLLGSDLDPLDNFPLEASQYFSPFPFVGSKFYKQESMLRMDQCSGAPLLTLQHSHILMYHQNSCIILILKEKQQRNIDSTAVENYTLLQVVKSTLDVLNSSLSPCRRSADMADTECMIRATRTYNLGFLRRFFDVHVFVTSELDYDDYGGYTFGHASLWAQHKGNVSRISRMHTAQLVPSENLWACSKRLHGPLEYSIGTNITNGNSLGDVADALATQASEYLTSYITEHNTEFTTSKGPPTDPYTFYALIITTALSVITIAVPFTNFILRAICHLRPFYLKSRSKHGAASRAFKVLMHVCGNVVLSLVFLLPVLSLAKNELERQDAFSTWDIRSSDLELMKVHPIRVIYLFSITSKYKSQFLNIIVLVICLTIVPVAVLTARRCFQVFTRYGLLLEESLVMANESPVAPLTSSSAFVRALKAIEMGEAEYLHLHHRVKGDLELTCHGQLFKKKLPAGLKQDVTRDAESSSLHFISRSSKY